MGETLKVWPSVLFGWQFLAYIFGKLTSWVYEKSWWTCQSGSLIGENLLPWQPSVYTWCSCDRYPTETSWSNNMASGLLIQCLSLWTFFIFF